jgi:WXXGXW repeat (2 copies)
MIKHRVVLLPGILGLLFGVYWEPVARAQGPPLSEEEITQKGVEVLTRGPIHEAFASPWTVNPRPNPIIYQKPPAAIEELPPDQKPEGAHIQWIPGYSAWDETGDDYVWISGMWRATPPGRQWMPGHWGRVRGEANGWQWVSGYWAKEDEGEVEYLPPPPPSLDTGPSAEAPDADSFYAPGCWVYRDRRYYWRPGFWQRSRADWYYAPAHYSWTPAGYIFSDGYWDYPLARRGLLFAPVRFDSQVYGWQDWNYQPRYVIGYQGLLGSLFARADYGRYYFGDYYGSNYNRLGFVPWFDYRVGRNIQDPFFNYSRWQSRNDPRWEANLRGLHRDRLAGTSPLPPTTLVQQHQVIQNIAINKTVKTGAKTLTVTDPQSMVQQMSVIAPLTKGNHNEYNLLPVAKATHAEQRQTVKHIQAAALDREKRETKLVADGSHPGQPTDASTKVKVAIPNGSHPAKSLVQAPPPPAVPKHVEQPLPKHENIQPLRVEPPKGKGKGPAQIQETPNGEEANSPPPKSKENDNPPPKAKEQKKSKKNADGPLAGTSNSQEIIEQLAEAGFARILTVAVFDVKQEKTVRVAAGHENQQPFATCAKVCGECQLECDACFHHCTQRVGDGSTEHARSMRLCVDCAELCSTAARLTARHSPLSAPACEACVKACDLCATSCERIGADKTMAACAKACRQCATECREMVKHLSRAP